MRKVGLVCQIDKTRRYMGGPVKTIVIYVSTACSPQHLMHSRTTFEFSTVAV